MKNLMTLAFLLLLGTGLVAATEPANVSSELLTKAVWTANSDATQSTIYYDFQQSGIVDIITQKNDGSISWSTSFWTVFEEGQKSYLNIETHKGGKVLTFELASSGSDVVLSNNELSARLSNINGPDMDVVKSDILGSWKSPFYDVKTGNVASSDSKVRNMWKLGFTFNEDGTFVRYTQHGRNADHEVGVWNLSNDGQFIKLHFAKDGNIEDIHKKEILNITDFKNDYMIVQPESNRKRDRSEIEVVDLKKK